MPQTCVAPISRATDSTCIKRASPRARLAGSPLETSVDASRPSDSVVPSL